MINDDTEILDEGKYSADVPETDDEMYKKIERNTNKRKYPIGQIHWLVDKYHVSKPDHEIEDDILKRTTNRPGWTVQQQKLAVKDALARHKKNQGLYRGVMSGTFKESNDMTTTTFDIDSFQKDLNDDLHTAILEKISERRVELAQEYSNKLNGVMEEYLDFDVDSHGGMNKRRQKRYDRYAGRLNPLEKAANRGEYDARTKAKRPNPYPSGFRHNEYERGKRSVPETYNYSNKLNDVVEESAELDEGAGHPRQEKKFFRKTGMSDPKETAHNRGQYDATIKSKRLNPYPPGLRHDAYEHGRKSELDEVSRSNISKYLDAAIPDIENKHRENDIKTVIKRGRGIEMAMNKKWTPKNSNVPATVKENDEQPKLYPFKAFHNGKSVIVQAQTSLHARDKAAMNLNVKSKNHHQIAVVRVDKPVDPASL